jgi:DNA-binding transcriptional ArsR family regulator
LLFPLGFDLHQSIPIFLDFEIILDNQEIIYKDFDKGSCTGENTNMMRERTNVNHERNHGCIVVKMCQRKLSNSAKSVLSCIMMSSDGISPSEIISTTGMSPRTVRYALRNLLKKEIVEMKSNLLDMRRRRYYLKRINGLVPELVLTTFSGDFLEQVAVQEV